MPISSTLTRRNDPASLAEEVRALAAEAYLTYNDPAAPPHELRALIHRIARLQTQAGIRNSEDLADWLSNVRGELVSRL